MPRRSPLPRALALLAALLLLPLAAPPLRASDTAEERARLAADLRYRLDADLVYEHLSPQEDYGDWYGGLLTLYARLDPRFTPFVRTAFTGRDVGGADRLAAAGLYAGWTPRLSTYTAVGTGSQSDYLQRWRLDHDFGLHAGAWTWVLGGGLSESHRGHHDWYLAAGPRLWRGRWIVEYRLSRNESSPGGHVAWNHLLSLGHGAEGEGWLFLTVQAGAEAYTATNVTPRQDVRHDVLELGLSASRWLGPTWGLKAQLRWLDLGEEDDGYRKTTVGLGIFKEF